MQYSEFLLKDTIVHIARVRRSRHFKVSIRDDGEVFATYPWYESKKRFIEFLESKYDFIVKAKEKARIRREKYPQVKRYDKDSLLEVIKVFVEKYVQQFNADGYNIEVIKVSIRDMTSRLGSCTPSRKTIRFSSKLCCYSDEYIEYVVVHELAHLVECNHSKNFWNIVGRYIKNYKKIEKLWY